jgi:CheY-like chemotaxis protein
MGRSGTGLGMAVVWGTVQDHQGYIDIVSTPDEGSIFYLYFPVTRIHPEKEHDTIQLGEHKGNGQVILIVDDVEEQREIATSILEMLNYSPVSVSSGEKAIAYLKTHEVDLILLDMIMDPGMDGLKTYQKILKIRPRQKAIVASGYAETDRVKQAQQLGADQYVKKPFTLETLAVAIKNELTRDG